MIVKIASGVVELPHLRHEARVLKHRTTQRQAQRSLTQLKHAPSEYSDTPRYPEVFDPSKENLKRRERERWYGEIQKLPTVEEKLWEIARQKYFGYYTCELRSSALPHLGYPYIRQLTGTRLVEGDLPLPCLQQEDLMTRLVAELRPAVCEVYQLERRHKTFYFDEVVSERERERQKCASLMESLNGTMLATLGPVCPALERLQVDHDPRVESYWFQHRIRCGLHDAFIRLRDPKDRHPPQRHRTHPFQYIGDLCSLQLRGQHPLDTSELPTLDFNTPRDPWNRLPNVVGEGLDPNEVVDPRAFGFHFNMRYLAMTPGFWKSRCTVGDPSEFPVLQMHHYSPVGSEWLPLDHLRPEDRTGIMHAQGILTSFGNLIATSSYQGFTPYNHLTYPLSCRTILSDGDQWSFYVYLMYSNTVGLRDDLGSDPNVCWATPPLRMFSPEDTDFTSPNEDCLRHLIAVYLMAPDTSMAPAQLRPYLHPDRPSLLDHPDHPDRDMILLRLRRTMANCDPPTPRPEIYNWEYIYKIKHNTRPLDRPDRFFEKFESLDVKWDDKIPLL